MRNAESDIAKALTALDLLRYRIELAQNEIDLVREMLGMPLRCLDAKKGVRP